MAHLVKLNDVWKMLEACAKGYTRRESREYWRVSYNGKIFPGLPLGAHGRRHNPEIESGHIRALIRYLGIQRECADQYLTLT